MADDKSGRDEQAHNAERRQRERDLVTELERRDETEPPVEEATVEAVVGELADIAFPATGSEVVAAVGDRTLDAPEGTLGVEELVANTDAETFESPAAVRLRLRRPTVATAMKRIVEASHQNSVSLDRSQREAYERTFRELAAIDAVDENEGIRVVADWAVDRIHEEGTLPGSRDVRRRAAKFCRANGYEVRNDEWLGV
jgi:hypothetical protein